MGELHHRRRRERQHRRTLDAVGQNSAAAALVAINPYDPEKHVWVVDDHMHAIYKFSHDGKQLVQTIGTPK